MQPIHTLSESQQLASPPRQMKFNMTSEAPLGGIRIDKIDESSALEEVTQLFSS